MQTDRPMRTEALITAFAEARARTEAIFAIAAPEAFYDRPIPLRHPIAFYEGHLDAFCQNTLLAGVLGQPSCDPDFDALFARGIDPASQAAADSRRIASWPPREEVARYNREVQARLRQALAEIDPDAPPHEALQGGRLFHLVLEHELMHQETLLYLLHELPHHQKRRPPELPPLDFGPAPDARTVAIPAGKARLGMRPGEFAYGWDNELPGHMVEVPAFAIDAYPVTNAQFLAFVEAGGYRTRAFWDDEGWAWKEAHGLSHPYRWRQEAGAWIYRGFFEDHPLPRTWPAYVTQAEAAAFARFSGRSLPTEAEWHRAAFGDDHDRPYPWGAEPPGPAHGAFDFHVWSPVPVGSAPAGASPFGVHDLVGNGWEWTETPFFPFDGFAPDPHYPVYSADFFDGAHMVLKGGCCFTAKALLRRSFRNWYYRTYPYPYAGFRLVDRR